MVVVFADKTHLLLSA